MNEPNGADEEGGTEAPSAFVMRWGRFIAWGWLLACILFGAVFLLPLTTWGVTEARQLWSETIGPQAGLEKDGILIAKPDGVRVEKGQRPFLFSKQRSITEMETGEDILEFPVPADVAARVRDGACLYQLFPYGDTDRPLVWGTWETAIYDPDYPIVCR